MNLTSVEQVFQTEQGEWVYRLRQTKLGVTVSRVPTDSQLWGHGVLKQMYDQAVKKFVPAIKAGRNVVFGTLEEAQTVIEIA